LEYHFFPKSLIHFSIGTLVAGGGIGYLTGNGHDYNQNLKGISNAFILEPEVTMFINVTRFFRIGIGGTYRFITGIKTRGVSDRDFRGFSGSLMFAFGWF